MTSRTRPPLTRERIVDAAIDLADDHGVAGLSMRKLAAHLDYEVMSLYNHIANKDDLLDAMVDRVAAEIAEPAADAGWREAAREIAMSAHAALRRRPWATAMWSNRWPGPNRWRHMETLLRVLAVLPDDLADLGFHAITLHIQGFTQQQQAYATQERSEDEMFERFAAEVSEEEFPHVVAHVRYHVDTEAHHDEFGFVLDLILDGLERA